MTLTHLNSDQRQYFWMSVVLAGGFAYLALKFDGLHRVFPVVVAVVEGACALSIYRGWRHAPWIYLLGCICLIVWATMKLVLSGYAHMTLGMLIAGLLSSTGYYWLKKAMNPEEDESDAASVFFELPKEHEDYVNSLVEAYSRIFGDPQWVHHLIPKPLWLHRYADYVITIPPTETRSTWLYGTLLVSAFSGSPIELILERPEEDTTGAIGTLCRLTEYFVDYAPLEEWNTMGIHPFFGEESAVRGLLFCKPPHSLPEMLQLPHRRVDIRYVAGITEEQLATAQAADKVRGRFEGARALHAELRIAEDGIANLPN